MSEQPSSRAYTAFRMGHFAACCIGFFGFLRCSELVVPDSGPFNPQVHLSLADIVCVHDETHNQIEVQIKLQKWINISTRVALGATGTSICLASALLDYLTIKGNHPGALFINENGSPMQSGQFVLKVQQALQQTRVIGHHFNSQSFRIGAATSSSQVNQRPQSRSWMDGQAWHINSILGQAPRT